MATILSHRGLWATREQRNSLMAIEASLQHGFGIETDVRDCCGELLISHDPPRGDELTFASLLDAWRRTSAGPLALNVKADGLQNSIRRALSDAGEPEYFVFDMSIPDAIGYRLAEMRYFARQSEYEALPALYAGAAGVWLDSFEGPWFSRDTVAGHLDAGKQVCVVSPELHGRDHRADWESWADWDVFGSPDVMLCTDLPLHAAEAFAQR